MIRRPPRSTPLSLHDALPISVDGVVDALQLAGAPLDAAESRRCAVRAASRNGGRRPPGRRAQRDRKSTRLNSSHANISYAVFCLKKKTYFISLSPRLFTFMAS